MIKTCMNSKSILLKALCTALVLILSGSLFAAGAMPPDGCGLKCCCQNSPNHVQRLAEKQMRAPMGCCSGVPASPCDLQPAKSIELPEMTLVSSYGNFANAGGSTAALTDAYDNRQFSGGSFYAQDLDPKFNSPPLYLLKLSFLIWCPSNCRYRPATSQQIEILIVNFNWS